MIDKFSGEYRWLSNFWRADQYASYPIDRVIPTVEHGYQAQKTDDRNQMEWVLASGTPSIARRRGRLVAKRPDWDEIKYKVMYDLVFQKFAQNPDLLTLLKATDDQELIEGNTWGDTYWGIYAQKGENNLGKILMDVRKRII